MRVSKNIDIAEFQKCGEIMVAAKRNKFAMACNFCQQTFTQLQAFMRHLQLQHNDELEFVKQAKEVEVYAVEELMNQTTASCAPDTESDESNMTGEDTKWLSAVDMKWLKQGVAPGKELQENEVVNKSKDDTRDEDDLGLANMSILRALEDCDVSFNLMDSPNNTGCSEEEKEKKSEDDNDLNNTLLREIQNEWEDSDTNESILKRIDCTDTDIANSTKHLIDLSTEFDADVTMTEMPTNSTCIDNKLDTTADSFETSPCNGIKNLLQGLEDLDDVDSLLENLESNLTSQKTNQEQVNLKVEKKIIKNCKLNGNQKIKSSKINTNIKENLSKAKHFTQKLKEEAESNILNNFEKRLKQMELDLDVDISSDFNIETKNSKSSKVPKKIHKQNNDFASKLKYLEDSLNECTQQEEVSNTKQHANRGKNIRQGSGDKFENKENSNEAILTSFEEQLKNLEESLNGGQIDVTVNTESLEDSSSNTLNNSELNEDLTTALADPEKCLNGAEMFDNVNTESLEDSSSNTINNSELNEDLTKALADALGEEDFDLFNINIPPEEENEEQLNQDILNLLSKELMEKESEQQLTIQQEKQTVNAIKELKENKIKSSNKQRKSLISAKNNIKSKYQKTNLKAKTKLSGTNIKNVLNSPKLLTLKENNTFKAANTIKESLIPLKGNHEIFLQQQQISVNYLLQSPAKTATIENINGKIINNSRQRKTPNKENQENNTPDLNIRNIKKEKLTPATNFINTDRGDKTPLKREQIFLKQSPKTQEKQETAKSNVTPKRGDKTPQEKKVKQSPKTQEKLEKLNTQQTPPAPLQRTPKLTRTEVIKQSPKTQEKLNKSPQNNKTPKTPENKSPIYKEPKSKSPLKGATRSNDKLKANPTTSPKQITTQNSNGSNYNQARTPLTTPQRLRNVAIKLQRFTPDKATHKLTKQEQKSLESAPSSIANNTEQIMKQFKLPSGISLTKISQQCTPQEDNKSEIIETPVKPTYCQQNFSESSLESIQQEEPQSKCPIEIQTTLIQPQCETINKLKTEANSKLRQRKASIDIVPEKIQPNNQSSGNKTPRHSNLDYKSYTVNRSARKKEVLQRMRHIKKQIFKSIEGGECVTKVKRMKSPLITQQKKRKVLIENVQILPNLQKESLTPLINPFNMFKKPFENTAARPKSNSVSPKNLADDQKQAKVTLQSSKNESSINDDEKLIKKSLKRPATSPLLNEDKQNKRQYRAPAKKPIQAVEKTSELEATQLDLSESVVDFLQRDLKANRLNVESFLNEDMPVDDSSPAETSIESNTKEEKIQGNPKDEESTSNSTLIDDLLEQVDNEKDAKENATDKDKTLNGSDKNIDFDYIKDINLLAKFGLKVIKLPEIEDVISLEERDEMNEKAMKFSNMYKYWQKIWSTKYGESPTTKEQLDICFKQLLTELNLSFKLDLSLIELKRLVNLINIWYSHNFNGKLIEKQKISDSTNRYLLMFHYIPKTIKRLYYCEYCEEYFNTEHKYFTHRIVHTGALYAYTCQKCSIGFKTVKSLRTHESSCDFKNSADFKPLKKTYELSNTRAHSCSICKEILPTSELLYEHSKKHLKTIYNCVKCALVFASAIDVHNHMSVCNTNEKRIPKQCTPRPTKPKTESYSKN